MIDSIRLDPKLCHGKPCIRGLRYPVEDILADYEDLTREDILAALAFAAKTSDTAGLEPAA